MNTPRIESAHPNTWVAMAALCAMAALAAVFVSTTSNPNARPVFAEKIQPEFDGKTGWYEVDSSQKILVVPSARGGLYVADFANFNSGRIEQDEDGDFVWTQRPENVARSVEFHMDEDGVADSFSWVDNTGARRTASKLDGHGYEVEEVFFANATLELAGTLYTPLGDGPHPGVAFIHGSGASDRDNLWYQAIVHHLVDHGVAVLLPDKRGTGKSDGAWETASFADFANDALAGIEFLKTRELFAPTRIGIVGISQGGWIAPLCAEMSSDVAFVVDISGTTVRPNEQLVHELGGGAFGNARAKIAKMRRPTWWKKNGDFDPMPHWKSMKVPGLILYGEDDEEDNVPVKRSVDRIDSELPADRDITVRVFAKTGHGMMDSATGKIRRDFLDLLSSWIREKAPVEVQ